MRHDEITDNAFPALTPAWHLFSVVCDGSSEKGFVNGVLKGAASFPMNTAEAEVELGLRIARSGDASRSGGSDGDFAELLIYDRALDAAEQRQVEDYLSAKWFGTRMLTPSSSLVWLDPGMDGILSFDYSRETGQFLLVRGESGGKFPWRFNPGTYGPGRLTEVQGVPSVQTVQWMGKDAFAYTSSDPNQRGVFLADFSGTEKGRAFEQGKVDWQGAAPDGSKLLIVGTISNEPSAGIWQYDLASSRLQPVVHYSEYPSSLIKRFDSSRVTIKLPSGRSVDCTIFPPANFDRHKKYPLIILDGVWAIDPPWMLAAETCGAYVAVTKRAGWWDGMEQINEHIMGAYQYLIQNTNIDALQVYPCGVSAETRYFNKLVTATPGLWKGVLLIQATQYPDFSSSPPFQTRPKILVTAGGRENKEERLKQFQKDALNQGVVVDYFVYPDDPHVITGNGSRLGRSRDLVHFMFEE